MPIHRSGKASAIGVMTLIAVATGVTFATSDAADNDQTVTAAPRTPIDHAPSVTEGLVAPSPDATPEVEGELEEAEVSDEVVETASTVRSEPTPTPGAPIPAATGAPTPGPTAPAAAPSPSAAPSPTAPAPSPSPTQPPKGLLEWLLGL